MPDIVIIGGGITGTAAALELASEGHAVMLLEKHGIAAMASGWTLGGVRQSGRDPAELPLASAAVAIWPTLNDRLGSDIEYRQHGNLRLARDENEVETIRELVERQRRQGLELHLLASNADVRAVSPALSDHVLAASFCPSDGHANPILATRAFAEAARRQGVVIREDVEAHAIRVRKHRVAGVETSEGFVPAAAVVVAAGANTRELIAPLGLDLPLTVTVVDVLQTEPLPATLPQVFGVANADCAGRQEVDGRLRVTSGSRPWAGNLTNWSEEALKPSTAALAHLTHLVGHVLPVLNRAPVHRVWGGLIDLTPDALPVLDAPSAVGGLVVAAGFSGHGFCLGPISGKLIADLALGRPARIDLAPFRLDRFAAGAPRAHDAPLTLHG